MTKNVLLLQYAEQTEPSSFINCMSTPYGTLVLRMGVFVLYFKRTVKSGFFCSFSQREVCEFKMCLN